MNQAELKELADDIEAARTLDEGQISRAAAEIGAMLAGSDDGLARAPGALSSTDTVLLIVDRALPGWAVSLDGTASEADGHWTCVLRKSHARDDDETIGIGKGPVLAHALLAALLTVRSLTRRD